MTLDVATALMHAVEAVIEMPCTATVIVTGRRWMTSLTKDMELGIMTATAVKGCVRITGEAPKGTIVGYDDATDVVLAGSESCLLSGGGTRFVRLLHETILAIDIEARGETERFWSRDNGETSDGSPRPADGDDAGHDDCDVRTCGGGPAGRGDYRGRGPDDRRHRNGLRE